MEPRALKAPRERREHVEILARQGFPVFVGTQVYQATRVSLEKMPSAILHHSVECRCTPYDALNNTPYALNNTPYALNYTPYALNDTPYAPNDTPYAPNETQPPKHIETHLVMPDA